MNTEEGKIWYGIGLDTSELKTDANRAGSILRGISNTADTEGARIDNAFKKAGAAIGTVFTVQQAASFAKQIVTVRRELQQLEVAFKTMLGSKSKVNALMAQMVETAAKTPFDLKSVAGGAKQLLAYGSASEKVNEELIMLGNVAAGLSIPLNDMVYLYGTTQTQGKLFAQDLNQFMERGIPLAEELAKQFGVTKEQVGGLVTAGKVGFPEVQKALQAMTDEGGKFYNLMEEQSNTIIGQISNLGDAIDVMFNKIGQSQEGVISGVIEGTTSLVENYEKVGREIEALIDAYDVYKAVLIATVAIKKAIEFADNIELVMKLRQELSLLTKEQQAFNIKALRSPYVMMAVAVAVLAYGIYKLATAQSQAEKAQEKFNKKLEEGKKKQEEFASKTNELVGVISNETNTRYMQSKAFKELVEMYPDLLKNMSMEELLLMDNMEVQKLLNAERERLDRKSNNDNLAVAQQNLDKAKKELDEYQNSFLGKAMILTPGPLAAIGLIRRSGLTQEIADYQAYVDGFEKLLNEDKEALANARPVNIKIADLSENITLLQVQLKEIGDLQAAYAAANPYGYNPYDGHIEILNGQLSAKNAEKESLEKVQAAQKLQQNKAAADALKKLNQDILDDQLSLESERIAILEDGRKKRLAQSDLEHREKKAALKKEYDETVAEYKKLGKAVPKEVTTTYNNRVVEATNAKTARDTGINEDADKELKEHQESLTAVYLTEEGKRLAAIQDRYDKEREWADAQFKGGNMTAEQHKDYAIKIDAAQQHEELEALKKEFETFQQERDRIEDEYIAKRAMMYEKDGKTLKAGFTQGNVDELNVIMNKTLADIDAAMSGSTTLWSGLFENFAHKSQTDLTEIAENARNVLDYVNSTSEEDITGPKFGMTAEQLKALKNDTTAVAEATKRLFEIENQDNSNNPFTALINGVKKYKKSLEDVDTAKQTLENIEKKPDAKPEEIKAAKDAVGAAEEASGKIKANLMGAVADIGQDMSQIGAAFEQAGESLGNDTLVDVGQAVSLIGDTASKVASGDYLGAVLGLFTAWADAEGRQRQALEELRRSGIEYQREYNALQHDAAMESSDSIFGEQKLTDAKNYYAEAQKQQDLLNAKMGELANGKVVTGHEKTGLFGWGKGKDTFSDLLSTFPELIDANGEFDAAVAESILSTQKLDEGTTNMLTDCIDYSNRAEEAMEALNEIAAEIVGNMASSMTDAIFDGIENGSDAWDVFKNSGGEAIKALGKMMVEQLIVQKYLDKYSGELTDLLGGKDGDLNKEGIINLFGKIAKEMPEIYEMAADATQLIYDAGEEAGYDMTNGEDEEVREASKRGIATASQESVDENNGRLTAIQGHTYGIYSLLQAQYSEGNEFTPAGGISSQNPIVTSVGESMRNLAVNSGFMLERLSGIERNTSRLEAIENGVGHIRNSINDITIKGIIIRN